MTDLAGLDPGPPSHPAGMSTGHGTSSGEPDTRGMGAGLGGGKTWRASVTGWADGRPSAMTAALEW
ncbi:hypothetical protein [Amycolatopsis saalfeldensis]|uniref:hypothetical protein n=1 Tax=Amycolatopsis saalfeldensis TaxID=394193 RepID=UPI001160759B|nr:hypothetical protein [Amycolatopsis saalfeldensis]